MTPTHAAPGAERAAVCVLHTAGATTGEAGASRMSATVRHELGLPAPVR
ncbi:hypothetical protein [Streptomyces chartreusis]